MQGSRTQRAQAPADLGRRLEDVHDRARRGQRGLGQIARDVVAQGGEAGLVPRRSAGLRDERVERGGGGVVEHGSQAAVRRAGERQLGAATELVAHVADGGGDGQLEQAAGARAHRGALGLRALEHAHADRLALVDERRVAADGLAGARQRDRARQRADRPRAQAVLLEARRRGGQLRAQPRARALAQRLEVIALGDHPPALVLDAEAHSQVGGQARGVPRIARHPHAAHGLELARDRVEERAPPRPQPRDDLPGNLGHRHQRPAKVLRQPPDERGDEVLAKRGHEPVEPVGPQSGQRAQRDVHGDAVALGARLEAVAQRELEVALLPRGRASARASAASALTSSSWV